MLLINSLLRYCKIYSSILEEIVVEDLSGKTILVTGASKGIGSEIVRVIGKNGANVIAHYGQDLQGAQTATKEIPDTRKLLVKADLADPDGYRKLWQTSVNWQGKIDVLVLNAAIMPEAAITDSLDSWSNSWHKAIAVNATAPAFLLREAVIHFLANGGGNLIGLSSWAAQRGSGNPNLGSYAASKSVIPALIKTVARAYAKNEIFAYLIAPGIVRTAMSEASAKSLGGEDAVTATLAMGEWVPPKEIANLVAFLSTGKNKQMTGATFDVNGATYFR
jgi:NAD(P)-dependent dehydrogenase (short-subunit alcohol dehydrogenase family)